MSWGFKPRLEEQKGKENVWRSLVQTGLMRLEGACASWQDRVPEDSHHAGTGGRDFLSAVGSLTARPAGGKDWGKGERAVERRLSQCQSLQFHKHSLSTYNVHALCTASGETGVRPSTSQLHLTVLWQRKHGTKKARSAPAWYFKGQGRLHGGRWQWALEHSKEPFKQSDGKCEWGLNSNNFFQL